MWLRRFFIGNLLAALVATALFAGSCPGLAEPVSGEIVRTYAPIGSYAGHWGVDFAVPVGTQVQPAAAGEVTFAGQVGGVLSVTVHHGGGLRTSYSYLEQIDVRVGEWVTRSTYLGHSGTDHAIAALHLSVRVGDDYRDPARWLRCLSAPNPGLSLVPASAAYPAARATRHSRRYIRSPSSRSSICR